jgi:hypothetical protein
MRASRFSRVIFAIRTSTLALPKAPESWSLTSLREKLAALFRSVKNNRSKILKTALTPKGVHMTYSSMLGFEIGTSLLDHSHVQE